MRRFAMHLARTVEHTVDVDGMLERMSPEQFEEWYQYYQTEPWGDDWLQAGTIAATLHNEFMCLVHSLGGLAGDKPANIKKSEYASPEDFVPKIDPDSKPKKVSKITGQQEMLAWAKMMAGV